MQCVAVGDDALRRNESTMITSAIAVSLKMLMLDGTSVSSGAVVSDA